MGSINFNQKRFHSILHLFHMYMFYKFKQNFAGYMQLRTKNLDRMKHSGRFKVGVRRSFIGECIPSSYTS